MLNEQFPIIKNKYIVQEKIGQGHFGVVYKGIYKKTNELVAIKTEELRTNMKTLKYETTILKYLYENGCRHVPNIHWFGIIEDKMYLVMTFYDYSLYQYLEKIKCTPNTIIEINKIDQIMVYCINILESIHTSHVIHRDIKPHNIMIKNGELFLIDFGLATFYINDEIKHISKTCSHDTIIGSPKYASIHIHEGITLSRRDDLISLGYIYIFMMKGELPWDICNNNSNEIHDNINIHSENNRIRKIMKSWSEIEKTCKNINEQIWNYMNYCHSIDFEKTPNYNGLKQLFS
jgi:serine/threonine protein kinase